MSADLPPELSPRSAVASTAPAAARPRWGRRVAGWLATTVAVSVLVTSLGGWAVLAYYDGKINRVPGLAGILGGGADPRGPLTLLVVGSDSREGLTRAQRKELDTGRQSSAEGRRSDTMMIVHVSEDRRDVTVVSLPRDSYVRIPSYTDADGKERDAQQNKINAAYYYGGAPLLIRTVQEATGVSIDHYVEVGFAGVVKVVDALGGVDVCVPNAVQDRRSGLDLPAGTSHVDGVMGLAYVRARYIDPTADLGRMERQQQFVGSLFNQATSAGVLLNPAKLNRFLGAAMSSVSTDEGLGRDMLLGLAGELQNLKPKNIRFLTVPIETASLDTPAGVAVAWDEEKARALFDAIEADEPLVQRGKGVRATVAPAAISVQALNGSTVSGLASQATSDLEAAGFAIGALPTNADRSDVTGTVIRYDPRWSESVKTLQAAFPGASLEEVAGQGSTFQVLVGTDYQPPKAVKIRSAERDALTTRTAADNICG